MLPKAVLCSPARAGKQHETQRVAFTRQRLQRWLDGDRATLWQDLPSYKLPRKRDSVCPNTAKAFRQARCDELCGEGALSQACKALYKPGLLDPTVVLEEMRAKHPVTGRLPDLSQLGVANVRLAPAIAADSVKVLCSPSANTREAVLLPCALPTSKSPSPLPTLIKLLNTWGAF